MLETALGTKHPKKQYNTHVVWNCGTNARSAGPPFVRTKPSVFKIDVLTFDGFRSPTIRRSGPVIFTIMGPARYFADVMLMASPSAVAETSRIVGFPYRMPRW